MVGLSHATCCVRLRTLLGADPACMIRCRRSSRRTSSEQAVLWSRGSRRNPTATSTSAMPRFQRPVFPAFTNNQFRPASARRSTAGMLRTLEMLPPSAPQAMFVDLGMAAHTGGRCYLRFDDTNPEAEKQEYIDHIQEIIAWLGYTPWKARLL